MKVGGELDLHSAKGEGQAGISLRRLAQSCAEGSNLYGIPEWCSCAMYCNVADMVGAQPSCLQGPSHQRLHPRYHQMPLWSQTGFASFASTRSSKKAKSSCCDGGRVLGDTDVGMQCATHVAPSVDWCACQVRP